MKTEPNSRFATRRLALATAVTLAGSVITVLVVRAIALNAVTVPAAFTPLKLGSVVMLTVLGVLAAAGACQLLNTVSKHPVRTFWRVAPFSLVLSFIPDVGIWAGHAYSHTATASTVLPLMVMHVAVAGLCLSLLPRLGTEQAERRAVPMVPTAAPS
ncbi:MAG: DUF6069 family protein [Solirubrobacteraceae bacterium]|jgi:hypothetical protein